MPAIDDIIGIGLGFPMGVDGRGGLRMARSVEDVEEAIRIILTTAKGERRMRPEFGCAIHDYIFAPMDVNTISMIRYYIRDALARWEPRIELEDVRARPDPAQDGCLLIEILYRLRASNERRNLVWPFYTIPQED